MNCSKCGTDKDSSQFRAVPPDRNKRGFYSHCKQCEAATKKKSYEKNKAHYFQKASESRARYPIKRNARAAAAAAIKKGKIIKTPCIVCGETKVDAHHDDYSKPIDVIFLCRVHHHARHKYLREMGRQP